MYTNVCFCLMRSSDYYVHELLGGSSFTKSSDAEDTRVLVNKALVSHIEHLETQNSLSAVRASMSAT